MLARITYVDYVPQYPDDPNDFDGDLIVRAVGRSADGERVVRYIEGVRPHVYVPDDDDPDRAMSVESGYRTYDGHDCCRVTLEHPKQVPEVKDDVAWTYEGDIPFYRRVTWDYGLSGYVRFPDDAAERRVHVDHLETDIDPESVDPIRPRVAIGDLEVVDPEGRPFDRMKEETDAPIVAATWYDSYDEDYLVIVVDDDGHVDPQTVRDDLAGHWGEHELAAEYVDEPEITLSVVDSEQDLLRKTVGWFQRREPDVATGWNFVDFDWYYLLSRLDEQDGVSMYSLSEFGDVGRFTENRELTIQRAVAGLPAMDQMHAYCDKMTFSDWRSTSLEFVASQELGIGKLDDISVRDAYQHERSRMLAYNLLDVQLCVEMGRRYAITEFFLTLADLCGIQIYDTFSEKREVDGYIGSRRTADEVLPNQVDRNVETPAGGLVLNPGDGVYEDVAVLDLKSLYPSSMLTMNISPETLTEPSDADVVVPGMPEKEADVDGGITESDIIWTTPEADDWPWSLRPKGFDLEAQGLMPKYVAKLFRSRAQYKQARDQCDPDSTEYEVYDRRQASIKVIMNSFYGVANSRYYRLARDGVGDAITGISRYVLWRGAEYVESLGYEVIYGDTDSVLVSLDYKDEPRSESELVRDGRGLCNQLNAHMSTVADDLGLPDETFANEVDHGTDRHAWTWEFEKLYGSFIQCGSKKRYAGNLTWKEGASVDSLDVTGFEAERSDVMEVTSEVQAAVLQRVLDGDSFGRVSEYVQERIAAVQADADELHEIGLPWNLSKPLSGADGYGNLPRARAARYSNEHLDTEYSVGDEFRGYYVKRTPSFVPETDVIALSWTEDIPDGFVLDRERTVAKAFESALEPILAEMDWTFNEIREGKRNQAAADAAVMQSDGDLSTLDVTAADDSSDTDERDDSDGFEGAGAW